MKQGFAWRASHLSLELAFAEQTMKHTLGLRSAIGNAEWRTL